MRGEGTGVPGEKHDPVTFYPKQFSHELTRDRKRASAVRSRRLAASAMTRLLKAEFNQNCIYRFSSYRAVNTLHLGYANQSVNVV